MLVLYKYTKLDGVKFQETALLSQTDLFAGWMSKIRVTVLEGRY